MGYKGELAMRDGWFCCSCGASSGARLSVCVRCFASGAMLPVMTSPYASEVADSAIRTARDLAAAKSSSLDLGPELAEIVGVLPLGLWSLATYGPPGSGKSTLLLLLADRLTHALGPVLYVAAEEGHAASMSAKLVRLEMRSDEVHIACLSSPGAMLAAIGSVNAKVLMLDSITHSLLTIEDVARLQRESGVSVVTSLHATKSGAPRGSTAITHWADVVVRLEPGRWYREKSRYSATGEGGFKWTQYASA